MRTVTINLRIEAFQTRIDEAMQQVTKNIALAVQAEAIQNAPVDTGFLRNSIGIVPDGQDYVVYVGAEYALYQEARRSFLGAAADNIGGSQAEAIAKATLAELVN